jgi:diguanylate cyclase (GGDEF)-like protein
VKSLLRANLKTRLFLLILFAFIPAFGLAILSSVQRLHALQAEQHEDTLRLVRVMETNHAELMAQATAFLLAVSHLVPVERLLPQDCRKIMNDLAQSFPRYDTFGLAAPNGEVYCSAEPARLKGNIAHLRFFRDVLGKRLPTLGPYQIDPLLGKPIVYIGVPVMDAARQIKAVLFAAFDLSGFNDWSSVLQLPANSAILVFDQSGLILARYHDSDSWTGSYRPQAPLVQYVKSHGEEGVADIAAASGIDHLFAYTVMHKTVDQTVFLALGITADQAYAGARQAFQSDMASLAVACVLVLCVAWVGSDVLIVNKLRLLIDAANRIRRGELHVRSHLKPGPDEAAQLAGAIDSMADAIESRVTALQQHGLEMRQLRDMNDALQACQGRDEVYAVVRQFMQQLFPGRAGALYMLDASQDHFAMATQWLAPASEREFLPNDCWAVRRGKPWRVEVAAGEQLRCRHVQTPPPFSYLCVPIMVPGEIVGMLHLENDHGFPVKDTEPGSQALVEAAAEHAGLRLAHIQLRDRLHDQAMRDGLTGLFNRRYMEETLLREIRNAKRSRSTIAIIMLDIDHFKHFNDSFGHAAGDALLRGIGHLLQTQIRGGDLACRYGGEEFTIVLPQTGLQQAFEIAEKLRRATRQLRIQQNGAAVGEVTISLGMAAYPQHGATWEEVLHAADMALLQAKQTRDRSVVFEA